MPAKIYCLSGLGADEKIFSGLMIQQHTLEYLPAPANLPQESLSQYAKRLANLVPETNPVLLGVSFGGMLAIEIARHISVKKIIVVSGVKTTAELPGWMRLAGKYQLNKWLPVRSNGLTRRLDNRQLGVLTNEEAKMVQAYREKADPAYMEWAINEILNWKNDWYPPHTEHIHGDADKMFPIKNIQATQVIKGGTHIMLMNRAAEISECINRVID